MKRIFITVFTAIALICSCDRKTVIRSNAFNEINGHEYVDLGLPSGLKWATCNVGASEPEEYGNYFAWGETESKRTISNKEILDVLENLDDIGGNLRYDAATANWGSSWRMPTKVEIEELISNCTYKYVIRNGVQGIKLTGLNGNSIFFPAAGGEWAFENLEGKVGTYWSSTSYGELISYGFSFSLYFLKEGCSIDYIGKACKYSIRPVSE